ncbi:BZ3500_MvSof-1268-A1-R1_Chr3-1g05650 [Microbotryum saponariae]|uniref:BZ3500_MvSof-1268-A1-R1_Chr3-1g05650 protein n=1 Tax=Microbotryum saponariae TaxID=289078 RepID=A0A2X0LI30_9BASI|nr:BZ3500_MvSof-1268-A1-R1_Chr3-1g05650 [Microbotryum saponariae]SDA04840.1 BZ3501_MvSof-1269-A2-R1_Chr3-1g05320 [Microbotryum saponariae]
MQPMQSLALLVLALAPGLASALSIASPSLYTCQLTAYQTTCVNGPCNIHLRDASSQQDLWTKTNISSGTYTISWEPNVAAVSHMNAKSWLISAPFSLTRNEPRTFPPRVGYSCFRGLK